MRRRRPSSNPTAMKALPRPHCSDSNFSVRPHKGWVGSTTLIVDINRSSLGVLCRTRRSDACGRNLGSACASFASNPSRGEGIYPKDGSRKGACQDHLQKGSQVMRRSSNRRHGASAADAADRAWACITKVIPNRADVKTPGDAKMLTDRDRRE